MSARILVLAAGAGTRLGRPKALVELRDGRTLLECILDGLPTRLEPTAVVLGAAADEIRQRHTGRQLVWLENPAWASNDMFSSITMGLDCLVATTSDTDCTLLWPVDCPFENPEVIETLIEHIAEGVLAVVPVHDGQPGHPVALSALGCLALRSGRWPHLGAWLESHAADVLHIDVPEPGVLRNVNEPTDLQAL